MEWTRASPIHARDDCLVRFSGGKNRKLVREVPAANPVSDPSRDKPTMREHATLLKRRTPPNAISSASAGQGRPGRSYNLSALLAFSVNTLIIAERQFVDFDSVRCPMRRLLFEDVFFFS